MKGGQATFSYLCILVHDARLLVSDMGQVHLHLSKKVACPLIFLFYFDYFFGDSFVFQFQLYKVNAVGYLPAIVVVACPDNGSRQYGVGWNRRIFFDETTCCAVD